jgi:hypothetical protein
MIYIYIFDKFFYIKFFIVRLTGLLKRNIINIKTTIQISETFLFNHKVTNKQKL